MKLKSRKQDRKDSLLGWWVAFILILSFSEGKPSRANSLQHENSGTGGGEKGFRSSQSSVPISVLPAVKVLPRIDRSRVDPHLIKAAEGMEALFLDYMMKVMRQTVPKNAMDLESPATQIYRGMLDTSIAEKSAHLGGVGLADQIIAYQMRISNHLANPPFNRYNQNQGQGIPIKEKP
jgi:Rod binding domain-containing protein